VSRRSWPAPIRHPPAAAAAERSPVGGLLGPTDAPIPRRKQVSAPRLPANLRRCDTAARRRGRLSRTVGIAPARHAHHSGRDAGRTRHARATAGLGGLRARSRLSRVVASQAERSGSLNQRCSVLHVRLIMRGQSSMLLGYGLAGQSRFFSASSCRWASRKPTSAALNVGEFWRTCWSTIQPGWKMGVARALRRPMAVQSTCRTSAPVRYSAYSRTVRSASTRRTCPNLTTVSIWRRASSRRWQAPRCDPATRSASREAQPGVLRLAWTPRIRAYAGLAAGHRRGAFARGSCGRPRKCSPPVG
jgi:hypothetical protein